MWDYLFVQISIIPPRTKCLSVSSSSPFTALSIKTIPKVSLCKLIFSLHCVEYTRLTWKTNCSLLYSSSPHWSSTSLTCVDSWVSTVDRLRCRLSAVDNLCWLSTYWQFLSCWLCGRTPVDCTGSLSTTSDVVDSPEPVHVCARFWLLNLLKSLPPCCLVISNGRGHPKY